MEAAPSTTQSPSSKRVQLALLLIVAAVLAWSGIAPHDRLTWVLEVFPIFLGVPVLAATRKRFAFTPLAYVLMAVHAVILCIGAKYTYAEVPAFNWLRDEFGLARNYYDRVGHIAQGFVPAIIAREILVRLNTVNGRKWLFVFVTAICLAISACYEFIEWWAALIHGQAADAFLGTQGDVWDTQWDMFLAVCGAVTAQLLLGAWHDRQIRQVARKHANAP